MRVVIRVDGDRRIGGGHVMRCLTLADAMTRRGHDVNFVMADAPDGMADRVRDAGYTVHGLPLSEVPPAQHPPHAAWRRVDPLTDATRTAEVAQGIAARWLIWDHYGLEAAWVEQIRRTVPDLRVLAIDDLDDRALASDVLLDQTRLGGDLHFGAPSVLSGPTYALLRPAFAAARAEALARRDGPVRKLIVLPGLMDAAGLAPLALEAVRERDLSVEVVMGSAAQSVVDTQALCKDRPDWTLTLDADDVARRMVEADVCIGASGGTALERCCLGLPTLAITVAANQTAFNRALGERQAVLDLDLENARQGGIAPALSRVIDRAPEMAAKAAALCDGLGVERVVHHVEAS